jgi:hypothetical protein
LPKKHGGIVGKKPPPAMASPKTNNGNVIAAIRRTANRFVVSISVLLSSSAVAV